MNQRAGNCFREKALNLPNTSLIMWIEKMSDIRLILGSCVEQTVDVVVNAANDMLLAGGGICGAIFRKAGKTELTNACNKINRPIKTGHSVITPAFNIENAKAIIHAVGPDFAVEPKAFDKLYDAYYSALVIAKENLWLKAKEKILENVKLRVLLLLVRKVFILVDRLKKYQRILISLLPCGKRGNFR